MQPDLGIRGMRDVSRDLRTMQDAPSTIKVGVFTANPQKSASPFRVRTNDP